MSSDKRQSVTSSKEEPGIGSRVLVNESVGTVRYVGQTSFQAGTWIGVELDEPEGKNSGVVQGKRYFECKTNHGVFVRPASVKLQPKTNTRKSKAPVRRATTENRKSIVETLGDTRRKTVIPIEERRKSVTPQKVFERHKPLASEPRKPTEPRKSVVPERRKSIVPEKNPERRKAISAEYPSRRKTLVPEKGLERRKSIAPEPVRRKSIAPEPEPRPARRKSIAPEPEPKPARRKSIAPEPEPKPIHRKSIAPEPEPIESKPIEPKPIESKPIEPKPIESTHRPFRSHSILKSRAPITAPTTPDLNGSEEEEEYEIKSYMASPVSVTKEEDESSTEEESTVLGEEEMGMQDKQPVYGVLALEKSKNGCEQMVPMKEYEELRFRLKILENKRQEERERFREQEKVKEEAEQFLTLRNKLQDKIAELQKDVREARRELKEATGEKAMFEAKWMELADALEMMTLDKEVAEERAETLQQETDILKDRMAEISLDLDILRRDIPGEDSPETPLRVVQLERHNERLKEALVRLRDVTSEQEAQLTARIKTLELENDGLEEFQHQHARAQEQLAASELWVEELKTQLDDAMGTEDLVEQLTEKNLNLTERNDELQASLDDLEALKELADELEENHMETERQLQAEIDHRDMLLREQVDRLRANEESLLDYESTLDQFRQLVQHLQNDLAELRLKQHNDQAEKQCLSSQSQAMMSLNLQLQTTVMKTQAKSIDLELRKLEAMQANDRLLMIQPYLPESFFQTESDSISCYLLFRRLEFKSELIIRHLDQHYPVSEKIMEHVTESLITICELKQRAGWLSSLALRCQTYIKNAEPEAFGCVAKAYLDLVGVERKMNGIIDQFRTELDETFCLGEIQRVIAQVEHLVETDMNDQKHNEDHFFGLAKSLDLNADRMIVIFTFARQYLYTAVSKDGLAIDVARMDQDYAEPLTRLISSAKKSKIITKKLIRQLEDKLEEAMTLRGDHLNRFNQLYSISTKLCTFCFSVYRALVAYVDTRRGNHKALELDTIQHMLQDKAQEAFELTENTMWESALSILKALTYELETTHTQVESEERLEKITTKVAPWIQRASDIKAEVAVNHELEHKLQQHNEEVIRLMKEVRTKEQSLQEAEVKINLCEKRMAVARTEIDRMQSLEEELKKSVNQAQICTEHMEIVQNENDALETELNKLKKEASRREEKRQTLLRKANLELPMEEGAVQEMAGSYQAMAGQMEALKMSVRYLRSENAHLKSLDFARSLNLESNPDSSPRGVNPLKSLARETRVLIKDLRSAGASPRVVHLAQPTEHQTQQSVLYTLKQRSLRLRSQVHDLQISTKPTKATKLGLIKIPNLLPATHAVHLNSTAEFKQLHSLFLPNL